MTDLGMIHSPHLPAASAPVQRFGHAAKDVRNGGMRAPMYTRQRVNDLKFRQFLP